VIGDESAKFLAKLIRQKKLAQAGATRWRRMRIEVPMGIIFGVVLLIGAVSGAVVGGLIGLTVGLVWGTNPVAYGLSGLFAGGFLGLSVGLLIVRRALRDYQRGSGKR
jgi:hypothetical protein